MSKPTNQHDEKAAALTSYQNELWERLTKDPNLHRARKRLSMHEIRTLVKHASTPPAPTTVPREPELSPGPLYASGWQACWERFTEATPAPNECDDCSWPECECAELNTMCSTDKKAESVRRKFKLSVTAPSNSDATVESRIIASRIADKVLACCETEEPYILEQCQLLERAARAAALDEAAKLVCQLCRDGSVPDIDGDQCDHIFEEVGSADVPHAVHCEASAIHAAKEKDCG